MPMIKETGKNVVKSNYLKLRLVPPVWSVDSWTGPVTNPSDDINPVVIDLVQYQISWTTHGFDGLNGPTKCIFFKKKIIKVTHGNIWQVGSFF